MDCTYVFEQIITLPGGGGGGGGRGREEGGKEESDCVSFKNVLKRKKMRGGMHYTYIQVLKWVTDMGRTREGG